MPDYPSSISRLMDSLIEPVLNPPNGEAAIFMIDETARLHVAAVSGLLQHSDSQTAVDEAYSLIDKHLIIIKEQLYEVLYLVAKNHGLEGRSINDTNLQTRLDIEAQLKREGK